MIDGLKVFDSDAHYMEPPDLWQEYMPAEYRDRAPVGDPDRAGMTIDGRRMPTIRIDMTGMNHIWETRYADFAKLDWSLEAYEIAMEKIGSDRMALYPSRGLWQVAAWGLDPRLASEIVKAYHRWVVDFTAPDKDSRLVRIGQLDLRDVDAACAEARRCVGEHDFRGFYILPDGPLPGVTLERPYYDPLWSTLEELDVPVVIHNVAGTGLGQVGASHFGDWAVPRILFAFPLQAQIAAFQFILGGICERHPKLRVAILESGAGWIPYWMYWLEEVFEEYHKAPDAVSDLPTRLSLSPIEYFKRQFFVSFEAEESKTFDYTVDYLGGVENLILASDFPHLEGTFLDGLREWVEAGAVDRSQMEQVLWSNPCRLYGLQP